MILLIFVSHHDKAYNFIMSATKHLSCLNIRLIEDKLHFIVILIRLKTKKTIYFIRTIKYIYLENMKI